MAAVAAAPVSGLLGSSRSISPQSVNSSVSVKRKRDSNDEGSPSETRPADGANPAITAAASSATIKTEEELIHNFFDVLRSYDTDSRILQRPLSEPPSSSDEPQTKRQKPDGVVEPLTIAQKVAHGAYTLLDDLVADINNAVREQLAALGSSTAAGQTADPNVAEHTVKKTIQFREKTHELYRRELNYPRLGPDPSTDPRDITQLGTDGEIVLTVFGHAPQPRHVFSSLPLRVSTPDHAEKVEKAIQALQEIDIPNGPTTTRIVPAAPSEKNARTPTLGELFPSPRNLPPLQPPKAPKSNTKSTVLGFYHPELTEKSKYRTGSYFSQPISTGTWLDYSNATPSSQTKTKQRERAQSLAGHKPSSTELEMSEMEALFRRAFSSFAPSKDDTAAMVSSGQLGRMWWQRVGKRTFQRMIDAEVPEQEGPEVADALGPAAMEIDEDAIQKTIDEWDETLVDPSLEEAMGQKSDADKDVDEILQEVSDLVETLASYQRNRNLTLPTSQDRYSTDPINGDMLRNGSLAQQPTEEEMATYEALKAQLALIIKGLPPYAVARLNSDKLAELNVSTKIEVRSDEYRGVMEEDEPAARAARQQAVQAAASTAPRQAPHRAPSMPVGPFAGQQYTPQYGTPTRPPMPTPPYYQQTPVRPPPPPMHQRVPGAGPPVPIPPQRPPQGQPYRPTNGYPGGYAPQVQKAPPTSFAHTNMSPYAGSPNTPSRVPPPPHPGYGHAPSQPSMQQFRFSPAYNTGYPQHQQHQQAQQHHPQQSPYTPLANGAGHMAPRPMAPQVAPQPQGYGQSPQAAQARPPYGTPQGVAIPNAAQRHYNVAPAGGQSSAVPGVSPMSYAGVGLDQKRVIDQARSRAAAHERVLGFGNQVAGLAGIGLGGSVDVTKLAAARANMPGGVGHALPSPRLPMVVTGPPPPAMNGSQHPSVSPAPMPPSSASPAPGATLQKPPA